jgi:hypothetical protein
MAFPLTSLLLQSVHEMGLMRRRYGYYWAKLVGAVALLAVWVATFVWIGDSWWQLASAAVLGVAMTQIAFLGHDAAHRQMFKSGRWNDWVSLIIANLLVGISYGWWQSKHTRHHANPNKEGADPDIALRAVAMTPAISSLIRRSLHGRAGVHDDIQAGCVGALGGGLVDHAKLKPHGLDAKPILLGNGLVDHRADPLTVHKAIHDLHRRRDVSKPVISLLAEGVFPAKIDWHDAHA